MPAVPCLDYLRCIDENVMCIVREDAEQDAPELAEMRSVQPHLCLGEIVWGVGIAYISAKASSDAQQVTLRVLLVVGHPPPWQPHRPLIPQPGCCCVLL